MPDTDVNGFLSELDGGVLEQKLAHVLSETALGTIHHGSGNRKGKVALELTFQQVGDNDQVIVSHKLVQSTPTKRGKQSMEDTTETPMFVGKGGVLSISPPKEDSNGQFSLNQEKDGIHRVK